DHEVVVAGDHRPTDRDAPGLLPPLELPHIDRAGGGRPDSDAFVREQIPGLVGRASPPEIGGSANHHESERLRQAHVYHVAVEKLLEADAGIEALRHDADAAVVGMELDFKLWMT